MSNYSSEEWEAHVRDTARTLSFPATPDIASAVSSRLSASPKQRIRYVRPWQAAVVGLLVLVALFAVPPVRAAVVHIWRIGAITIFTVPSTPEASTQVTESVSPPPTALASIAATNESSKAQSPPRPAPTPTSLHSLLDLYGETTLEDARQRVDFPLQLPTHPAELGPPGKVFVQDLGGNVVIMVWFDPDQPDSPRFSLHQFGPNTFAEKLQPRVVRETTVNGQRAIWARGPHLLQVWNKGRTEISQRRLVNGHVLIWQEGEVTYRLESMLQLEEAIRVAESVR